MNFTRKIFVAVAAAAMTASLVGIAAPAEAKDTGWGNRTIPTQGK